MLGGGHGPLHPIWLKSLIPCLVLGINDFLTRVYSRSIWALHPADTWVAHGSPRVRGMVQPLVDLGFPYNEALAARLQSLPRAVTCRPT